MESRRWFHPNISGTQAAQLLMEKGVDGSFLARPSQSNPSDFTLSVRRGDEVTHIKIQNLGEFYDLYGGEKFASLSELVYFYTMEGNVLRERNGVEILLKYPLVFTEATTDRWFHGNISGRVAEKLLLEKGRNGSFLVRDSNSRPGDFVLSVKASDNSVTHIMIHHRDGKYDVGGGDKFDTLSELVQHYRKNAMIDITGSVVQIKQPLYATRVNATSISSRVKDLKKTGREGFSEEFKSLHIKECRNLDNRRAGQIPENRCKNRYKNILPVDDTRVILDDGDPNVVGSDYINANYIQLSEDDNIVYIATQGCLPNTIIDFWRMIWYKKCMVIALVTRLVERGKSKCTQYWSDEGDDALELKFYRGTLTIQTVMTTIQNNFLVREFELTFVHADSGETEMRTIYQFHFTDWLETNILRDPSPVLSYLQTISDKIETQERMGPLVVQCSAGIGRTGTFIVIDMIIHQIGKHGLDCEIDVPGTIQRVRLCRSGMVQSEQQYKFVYLAIMHFIEMAMMFVKEDQKSQKNGREYHNIRYTASFVNHNKESWSNLSRMASTISVSSNASISSSTSAGSYFINSTPSEELSNRNESTSSDFQNSENEHILNLNLNINSPPD